jgi:hypothetical protein
VRVTIHDEQAPNDVRIEVTDDRGGLATLLTSGPMYERMERELRQLVLSALRESLRQSLTTRLGIEAKKQPDTTDCDEHGVERSRCGCVPNANDAITITLDHAMLVSIADELSRNSTQALVGVLSLIEEV